MDGRVGHLHCRCLILSGAAPDLRERLARVAREHVAAACAEALDRTIGQDPAVYVIRNISVSFLLNTRSESDDLTLGRSWGRRVAQAAAREVSRGVDAVNVARFDDEADFVAQFLVDLLRGEAWDRWYYGRFSGLRDRPLAEAAFEALIQDPTIIAGVLSRVRERGSLERLLAALPPRSWEQIWNTQADRAAMLEQEMRPVFAAAMRFLSVAGEEFQPSTAERVFREFLDDRPSAPDWRDRAGLAIALLGVVEFLRRRGLVRASAAAVARAWRSRGDRRPEFDWLDTELVDAALDRLESAEEESADGGGGTAWTQFLSPRQSRLLRDLAESILPELPAIDIGPPLNAATSRLCVLTYLIARHADWAGDSIAAQTVEGLLSTARWLSAAPAGREWIAEALGVIERGPGVCASLAHRLRTASAGPALSAAAADAFRDVIVAMESGRVSSSDSMDIWRMLALAAFALPESSRSTLLARAAIAMLRTVATSRPATTAQASGSSVWARAALVACERQQTKTAEPLRFLRSFGEAGLDLAVALAAGSGATHAVSASNLRAGIESECAGVFLLVRAMLDARLAAAAKRADYPLAPTILSLGLCWGGPRSLYAGRLDPGIGLLAGQGYPMTIDDLRSIWQDVDDARHYRFQRELLRALAARRMLGGREIETHEVSLGGDRRAIVCGAPGSAIWPLGRVPPSGGDGQAALQSMLEDWAEATGERPDAQAANPDETAALLRTLEALNPDAVGLEPAGLTMALAAASILRIWSAWLRKFADSSVPYLLDRFVRRPGRITETESGFLVELAPLPLDLALQMAGYFAPVDAHPGTWERRIEFRIEDR